MNISDMFSFLLHAPVEVQYMSSSRPRWSHQERCGWLHRCDASGQAKTLHRLVPEWHFLGEVLDD